MTTTTVSPDPDVLREMLHEVIDPELGVDIVELALLREVTVRDGDVAVRFTVTTPACPLSRYIEDEIRRVLDGVEGLRQLDVECEYEPPWQPEDMSDVARRALGWPV
jgi:metal-sulfur cluster biosynthetic enzyme